jgi:hypothetical protein
MRSNTWIALLAYEARTRHAADRRREVEAAKRVASVRSRVLADLRGAIVVDIEGFLGADGDRSRSALTCRNGSSARGFVISRTDACLGTRSLAVDLEAGSLSCRYDQPGSQIAGAPNPREIAVEIGDDGLALSWWDGGLVRRFTTVDTLSAFLLAPILGGS